MIRFLQTTEKEKTWETPKMWIISQHNSSTKSNVYCTTVDSLNKNAFIECSFVICIQLHYSLPNDTAVEVLYYNSPFCKWLAVFTASFVTQNTNFHVRNQKKSHLLNSIIQDGVIYTGNKLWTNTIYLHKSHQDTDTGHLNERGYMPL